MNNNFFLLVALFELTISSLNAMHHPMLWPANDRLVQSHCNRLLIEEGLTTPTELHNIAEWRKFEHECTTVASPSNSCFMLPAATAMAAIGSTVAGYAFLKLSEELKEVLGYKGDPTIGRGTLMATRYGLKSLAAICFAVGSYSAYAAGAMSTDFYKRMDD